MSVGEGLQELVNVASDYTNNGMGKQGAYAAVRNARARAASMPDKPKLQGAKNVPTNIADAPATEKAPVTPDFSEVPAGAENA